MIVKFMEHGRGSAKGAINYLLAANDHKGEKRAFVQVLRGTPELVAAIADSLPFEWKYTSGVIGFEPSDKPTPEQIQDVLDDFERTAFAGLEPDQYSYTAVAHGENDGGVHVHFIVARVELHTQKSLNVAPPGHEKMFNAFRDKWNFSLGWASPDEKNRQRTRSSDLQHLREYIGASLATREDEKTAITNYLVAQIADKKIRNRADLIAEIQSLGLEISRISKDSISIKHEPKNLRLSGGIYGEQFDFSTAIENCRTTETDRERTPERDRERYQAAVAELHKHVEKRAKYITGRYKRTPEISSSNERRNVAGAEIIIEKLSDHEQRNNQKSEDHQRNDEAKQKNIFVDVTDNHSFISNISAGDIHHDEINNDSNSESIIERIKRIFADAKNATADIVRKITKNGTTADRIFNDCLAKIRKNGTAADKNFDDFAEFFGKTTSGREREIVSAAPEVTEKSNKNLTM